MTKPRFPRPLAPGDLIAVTAPSSGVSPTHHARLDRAIEALRQRGYRVVEGECLRSQRKDASATPAERAAELMRYLSDTQVAAVMPPWGGERAIDLLPLLDFTALAALPPKWLSGFSDLSTLQLPLALLAGWASLHGPNLMELGASDVDETVAGIWRALETDDGLVQRSSSRFQKPGASADWAADPAADLVLSGKTQWRRLDGSTEPLKLQGRLIGGCIDTIARLAGTPYGDVPGFVRSTGSDGALLYLENCEMAPCELLRALSSLGLHAWFKRLNGVLIGRSAGPEAPSEDMLSYVDALQAALGKLPCPVLYDLDIGHLPPQLSLINGALAELEFRPDGSTLAQYRR